MVSRLTGGNRGDKGGDRKDIGDAGEERALAHLQQQGLVLVQRNYRVAAGPSARAGEVDLIMRDRDREGTLVFVEVRQRARFDHGGAAASVTRPKQARIVYAARHYLQRHCRTWPPCRFDVVAIDGDALTWLVAAFDAG
jgi:putative endonuclease